MRSRVAEWLERLTANAEVATVLGSTQAYSDTVKFFGVVDEAVLNKVLEKIKNISLLKVVGNEK